MKFLGLALAMTTLLGVAQVRAESHFDRKANGVRIYDLILKQDVPEKALRRLFEFLDINADRTVVLKDKDRNGRRIITETHKMTIHDDYATIIDYSKPSNEPRMYLINLNNGGVEKYLVAHGRNSGAVVAGAFSNINDSKQSSLGLYVGGDIYYGKHGKSLQLHGIEASNSNAMFRDIVIHSANYVSYKYIKAHGRLGRSWGCPAVSPGVINRVLNTMQNGSVIYGYHKDLMTTTLKNPSLQILPKPADKGENRDLPGEEEDLAKKGKIEVVTPLKEKKAVSDADSKLEKETQIVIPLPRPRPTEADETHTAVPLPRSRPAEAGVAPKAANAAATTSMATTATETPIAP